MTVKIVLLKNGVVVGKVEGARCPNINDLIPNPTPRGNDYFFRVVTLKGGRDEEIVAEVVPFDFWLL